MSFSSFFKQNVKSTPEVEYKVSDRFDEPFRIKVLSETINSAIKEKAMKIAVNNGKADTDLDMNLYSLLLCVESITYPNLNDAELQDSYGVKRPDDLLKEMLTGGEFTNLFLKVTEVNKVNYQSFEEKVEEAKN